MHTKIFSATTIGVNAYHVEVEVDLSIGLIDFFIVGLPDTAIKESRLRIKTAIKNCGIRLPGKKITVNLAPAALKKEGTLFDLPIAIGILQAASLISLSQDFIKETIFLGELSLDGGIKPIRGVLPIACDIKKLKMKRIIVPAENAQEAALIKGLEVIGVHNLVELIGYLRQEIPLEPIVQSFEKYRQTEPSNRVDFAQVCGQKQAKRVLQIAAAGRHNILFIGPPGAGKTMLAQRLATIMPPMSFEEILETSKIYSITGKLDKQPLIIKRPFRNPHHTISQAGLVGGGSFPQPGEISLAHHGILFLDELTEFKRDTLEVLRQPLENKKVHIARVNHTITFPASFLLVVALNPCPCGFLGDKKRTCSCSPQQINRYLDKLSGPLLDRIDLQINVQSVDYESIEQKSDNETSSHQLWEGIQKALDFQKQQKRPLSWNAFMTTDNIEEYCQLTASAKDILKQAFERLNLSMRGYHKVLKVARTIADLERSEIIDTFHLQEALMYRSLDHLFDRKKHA